MAKNIHRSIKISLILVFFLYSEGYTEDKKTTIYLELVPPIETIFADGITDYGFTLLATDIDKNPVSAEKIEIKPSSGKIKGLVETISGLYNFSFIPQRAATTTRATFLVQTDESKKSFAIEIVPAEGLTIKVINKPEYILAGEKEHYQVSLHVHGLDKKPISQARLYFQTNIGTIKDIRDLGSGKYSAKYIPPSQRYPQTAMLIVRAEGEKQYGINWIRIPIYGQTVLAAETESNSMIKIRVADREFGPFPADQEGKFEAPIVVPPGYTVAQATVTDESGNVTEKTLDLGIPSFPRLLMSAYPPKVTSDGRSRARIYVFCLDGQGNPSKEKISLTATKGSLSAPLTVAPGISRAIFSPPNSEKKQNVSLHVHSEKIKKTVNIKLTPGRFHSRMTLEASPQILTADGHSTAKLKIKLYDDSGTGMSGEDIQLKVDKGSLGTVTEQGTGEYSATLTAPTSIKEGKTITVTALTEAKTRKAAEMDSLHKTISVGLQVGKAVKATIKANHRSLKADGKSHTRIFVFVTDKEGNKVTNDTIRAKSSLGKIKDFKNSGEGNYRFIYTAPDLPHAAREAIAIFNREGDLISSLTIYLTPRPKYFNMGLKGAYLTNFNKISTPHVRLELGSRLPILTRQIFINFEAGYYPENREDQGIDPDIGQYSVDLNLNVYSFSLNGLYKLESFNPVTPYLGFGCGIHITSSRIASSFQSSLSQTKMTYGGRAFAGLELKLGPGLGLFELAYDYASLSNKNGVKGNLGGLMFCLGYRYYFY